MKWPPDRIRVVTADRGPAARVADTMSHTYRHTTRSIGAHTPWRSNLNLATTGKEPDAGATPDNNVTATISPPLTRQPGPPIRPTMMTSPSMPAFPTRPQPSSAGRVRRKSSTVVVGPRLSVKG